MLRSKLAAVIGVVFVVSTLAVPAQAATYEGCRSSVGLRFGVSPAPSEADPTFLVSCLATYPATGSQGRGISEAQVVPPGANFARPLKFTYDSTPYGDTKSKGSTWGWFVAIDGTVKASGFAIEVDSTPTLPGGGTGFVRGTLVTLDPTAPASQVSVVFYREHVYSRNWGAGSAYCGPAGRDGGFPTPC